jgi:CarD family transcriptional regulator
MLKKGDRVVYPLYGRGSIVDRQKKIIDGQVEDFYVIKLDEKEAKIMVPVKQTASVGLRKLVTPTEINKVMEILAQAEYQVERNWIKRYKSNFAKLKSGSIFQIAQVVRYLATQEQKKPLSISEKNMLKGALNMLTTEISEVKKTSPEKVFRQIKRRLKVN